MQLRLGIGKCLAWWRVLFVTCIAGCVVYSLFIPLDLRGDVSVECRKSLLRIGAEYARYYRAHRSLPAMEDRARVDMRVRDASGHDIRVMVLGNRCKVSCDG